MRSTIRRAALLSSLFCLAAVLPATAKDEPAPKSDTPKATTSEQPKETPKAEPKEKPKEEVDPFKVPEGTPEELLKYIDEVRHLQPKNVRTRKQFVEFGTKIAGAILEAADKVLAAKPTDAEFDKAAQAKFSALGLQTTLKVPNAEQELTAFIDQLNKAGKKELARTGKAMILQNNARSLTDTASARKLFGEVKQFLSEGPVTRADAGLMLAIGQVLEYGDDPKLAAEAFKEFAGLLAKSDDAKLAGLAKRFEAGARRLDLPGNPIEIEGVTMDGKPFDWAKFQKGKVVLVDFWATWCGWCIREIPETKELYKAYHDRGFDIVAISGDRDREDLVDFLKDNELPWTILYGKDGPSQTIGYYGISAFPTMLLVDKDGKVVSLRARGPVLRAELARLLGPIDTQEDKDKEKENKPEGKQEKNKKDKQRKKAAATDAE
jgi:thiol-disulfide isomerase/thioredoxin